MEQVIAQEQEHDTESGSCSTILNSQGTRK